MSTILTFYAKNSNLVRIQNLVKKFDGRFVRNPFDMFKGMSQLEISFEDSHKCNEFSNRLYITEQPFF